MNNVGEEMRLDEREKSSSDKRGEGEERWSEEQVMRGSE